MSATRKSIFCAVPSTTRGRAVHLGLDPKGVNFLYPCGKQIVIRNLKDPMIADLYSGHSANTTVARYSPSGYYIASGDETGHVLIWDTVNDEHILKIDLTPISGVIHDMNWDPDSKRIVCVGEGKETFGSAFIFDTGATVGDITGHSKSLLSCDFKPNRPFALATAGEDFQMNFFRGPPFKFKRANKDHGRFVNCVRFAPDGSRIATCGSDMKVFLYDGREGEKVAEFAKTKESHQGAIYSLSWSPDGKHMLTASADRTTKLWDVETGSVVQTWSFEKPQHAYGRHLNQQVGTLWSGDFLLSLSLSGDMAYLDTKSADPVRWIYGHNKSITAATLHEGKMYTAGYDGQIRNWDLDTGSCAPFEGKGHTNQVVGLGVHEDELVSVGWDDMLRSTSLENRDFGKSSAFACGAQPKDVAVSKKNKISITATLESIVVADAGRQVFTLKADGFVPTAVAISVDETEVAVGAQDGLVRFFVLDGTTLKPKDQEPVKHRGDITSLTYSPDGQFLASADKQRDIFLWDAKTKECKQKGWQFHTARVDCLAWAPDSLHLASGSLDGKAIVWSIEAPGKRIVVPEGVIESGYMYANWGGVSSLFWTDDTTLATAGADCNLTLWDIKF